MGPLFMTVFMNEDDIPEIERSPWVDNFFRPALIVAMIMCLNYSLVNFARLINPAWRGTYFLLGMLLTAVEAIYSYRALKRWRMRGRSLLQYRLAEATVLIILLKLLSFAAKLPAQIWLELWGIWQNPLSFITVEFYMMLGLAMISWIVATFSIDDFEALYDPYTFRTDKILPFHDLLSRFFWGGIFLVIISGVSQIIARAGVSSLADWQRPTIGGIVFNVMLYFMLGLILLSQANLTRLLVRWRVQKLTVAPDLIRQWGKYALVFLVILTGFVFLLPTTYTLGFLETAAVGVRFLLSLLFFLAQLVVFLITLPFVWLLSLLTQTPIEQTFLNPPPPPVFDSPDSGKASPWLEVLRSLIFWLMTLALIGYLLKIYLQDHTDLFEPLKRYRLFNWIITLLKSLWGQLTGLARLGLELLPRSKTPPRKKDDVLTGGSLGWLRQRLSPRERILAYYRNVLRRVASQGRGRKLSQTPYEYQPDLSQTIPDAQSEIEGLTNTFVQARYSQATFDQDQAQVVKQQWQRIKKGLRK